MSQNYRKLITLVLVCILITACEAKPADHPNVDNVSCSTCHHFQYKGAIPTRPAGLQAAADPDLANTRWLLVSYGQPGSETPVKDGSTITLSFYAAGQAGGFGGCNQYSAPIILQGNNLSFGKMVHSSRSCQPDGIDQQEQKYFQALASAESFEMAGDWLAIRYDQGKGVLNLVKFPGK